MSSQKSTYRSIEAKSGSGLTVLFSLTISFIHHVQPIINTAQIAIFFSVFCCVRLVVVALHCAFNVCVKAEKVKRPDRNFYGFVISVVHCSKKSAL